MSHSGTSQLHSLGKFLLDLSYDPFCTNIDTHGLCASACPKLYTTYTYGSSPCTLSSSSFTEVYILFILSTLRVPDLLCPSIVLMSQSLDAMQFIIFHWGYSLNISILRSPTILNIPKIFLIGKSQSHDLEHWMYWLFPVLGKLQEIWLGKF